MIDNSLMKMRSCWVSYLLNCRRPCTIAKLKDGMNKKTEYTPSHRDFISSFIIFGRKF